MSEHKICNCSCKASAEQHHTPPAETLNQTESFYGHDGNLRFVELEAKPTLGEATTGKEIERYQKQIKELEQQLAEERKYNRYQKLAGERPT